MLRTITHNNPDLEILLDRMYPYSVPTPSYSMLYSTP